MAAYSVLIKGGMVVREKKLLRLDVGIKDDKIQDLGDLSRGDSPVVIDASGRLVAPGFVDLTSHSDTHWTLFSEPSQESFLRQGVTTILGGNCGSSLAPLVKAEDIAGIGKWVDVSELNINWQRMGEFFKELSGHKFGVNFGTLVGHGTLRRGVVGDQARRAAGEELEQMKLLLKESLEKGAFGLSTSLGAAHGRAANFNELAELFELVESYGGITKHHLKDEGKNILPAIVELIQLGRDSGAKVHFSHFKLLGRLSWPLFHDAVSFLDSAREEGLGISLDIFPYTRTGSLLYLLLPPWIREGGREQILKSLRDKTLREETKNYLKALTLHYERLTIASTLKDPLAVGKTLWELARSSGLVPEEVILNLLESSELKVSIFSEVISEENLEELLKKDYTALASDGVGYASGTKLPFDLPHPRSFGAFPRALELFAKEKNVLTFAELVYKMTEGPASILGLAKRGKIQKGFFADLVVLDPEAVLSRADYHNPYLVPEGIEWVLVNGKVVLSRGHFNGNLAGRILKRA